MKVRELIIQWGFDVDTSKLKPLEQGIKNIKDVAKTTAITLAAIGTAAGFMLNQAGKFEQWQVAFDTMLGSAEEGAKMMAQIKDFALKTPFELPGLIDGTKRLMAYGVTAKEVIPTLDVLGNIVAGVGTDKTSMNRLILALGQVKTKGRLMSSELRQFTEAGVPLGVTLAASMQVPPHSVDKLIQAGKVSYEDVLKALTKLTEAGGKFHNLMEKQANTLLGKWSILKKTLLIQMLDTGDAFREDVKSVLTDIITWFKKNKDNIRTTLVSLFTEATKYFKIITEAIGILFGWVKTLVHSLGGLKNTLKIIFTLVAAATLTKISIAIVGIVKGVTALTKAIKVMGATAAAQKALLLSTPGLIALALGALILIGQDIGVYFSKSGGRSITGMLIEFFRKDLPTAIKFGLAALNPLLILFAELFEFIKWVTSKETQDKMDKMMKTAGSTPLGQGVMALAGVSKAPALPGGQPSGFVNPLTQIANMFTPTKSISTPSSKKNVTHNVVVTAPVNIDATGNNPEKIMSIIGKDIAGVVKGQIDTMLDTTDASIEDEGE